METAQLKGAAWSAGRQSRHRSFVVRGGYGVVRIARVEVRTEIMTRNASRCFDFQNVLCLKSATQFEPLGNRLRRCSDQPRERGLRTASSHSLCKRNNWG